MSTIKADLHMHGAIGFQDSWLNAQGYSGKNLLQLISDKCFERDIGLCAVTSEYFEIPKGSRHDRLGYLKDNHARTLPEGYATDTLGENILIVGKEDKKVSLINGQTVIINEDGRRFDYLVVGSNQVPNKRTFEETHKYCRDNGLIKIAEHPELEQHLGMGLKRLEENLNEFHAIEGHNGQLIIPKELSFVPLIGKYNKGINEKTIAFAEKKGKPWIATSDAHDIPGLGIAYIQFDDSLLDKSTGDKVVDSLTRIVSQGSFTTHRGYQDLFSWLKWTAKFKLGIILGRS